MSVILIITPFRNEEHSIPQYLESLLAVDYPPELIDVYWLENDSSDRTLSMLKDAKPFMPFNSVVLESAKFIGPVKKKPPGDYVKDIPYGQRRVAPWIRIWREHFMPQIRKSRADYVLAWYADSVSPTNVIREYLKVYDEKNDAGWVGGAIHRRYPRQKELHCPSPVKYAYSKRVVRVKYIGHVWMMPRASVSDCEFGYAPREMHFTLIDCLERSGLYVYYQPSVFLKHVSTDGKIYKHRLGAPFE